MEPGGPTLLIQRGDILTFGTSSVAAVMSPRWEVVGIDTTGDDTATAVIVNAEGVVGMIDFPHLRALLEAGLAAYSPLGFDSTHAYASRYAADRAQGFALGALVGQN